MTSLVSLRPGTLELELGMEQSALTLWMDAVSSSYHSAANHNFNLHHELPARLPTR